MVGKIFAALLVALVGAVGGLYISNSAPALPPISAAEATEPSKPYIVKLHAQWCPYCLMQKDEWAAIERAYADRANLLVLDFTDETATEKSRTEAERLNLGWFLEHYGGATGVIAVLDNGTREVLAELAGNGPLEEYRAVIDAALELP